MRGLFLKKLLSHVMWPSRQMVTIIVRQKCVINA